MISNEKKKVPPTIENLTLVVPQKHFTSFLFFRPLPSILTPLLWEIFYYVLAFVIADLQPEHLGLGN